MVNDVQHTRREFLFGSAGIAIGFSLNSYAADKGGIASATSSATDSATVSAWVKIQANNRITIMSPSSELGQGSMTSVPMMFAEEMDANWDDVDIEFSPSDDAIFHNPTDWVWGIILTLGSSSVSGYFDRVRQYGAQTRKMLMLAAAEKWGVELEELVTEPSVVLHKSSGRQLTYGEISAFMKKPEFMPEISEEELKKRDEFRIIGTSVPRCDIPAKVTGQPVYSIDANPPGMVFATVKRTPVRGAKPLEITNEHAISARKDILQIVTLDDAVAIVASTYEAAYRADALLDVRWSQTKFENLLDYDQQKGFDSHRKAVRDLSKSGAPWQNQGDAEAAIAKAAKVYEAEYSSGYLYHAQLEPLNSVAQFNGDELEVWAGTQAPTHLLRSLESEMGIPATKVRLHRSHMGGAFGRRGAQDHDYVLDSVRLSKTMDKPVKVIWRREEDFHAARVKPITWQYLRAAENEEGELFAWSHRSAGDEPHKQADPYRYEKNNGWPVLSGYGLETGYDFSDALCEVVDRDTGVRTAAMRGLATVPNKFGSECFIDEIAAAKGIDPVQFRLGLLRHNPEAQKMVNTVAEMANWSGRGENSGLGFAFGYVDVSSFAIAAQVECNEETGVISVPHVWIANNVGLAVNPNSVEAQLQGGVVFGLSTLLKEKLTYKNGAIEQSNFHQYNLLRIDEAPEIHIRILETEGAKPVGTGDNGTSVLAAAVGNGFTSLTGKRLRQLPLTPDNVLAALTI